MLRKLYLPDTSKLAHLNVPAHRDALGSDDVQSLSVGADLAGIQRLAHRSGQISLVHLALQRTHTLRCRNLLRHSLPAHPDTYHACCAYVVILTNPANASQITEAAM